jgi:lipopolysaccharide transport system ATP-binding protein
MSDVAIKVEGLGKRYKIGKLQRRHDTLRDRIADVRVFNFFKRRNGNSTNGHGSIHHSALSSDSRLQTSDSETLWALKDVSFEVKRGEVVGIIGRNGAGKSTLLKILSRITEPTQGYADINGRVGSLLEVGTGFQPELSGRENIYLNGAILGMKRAEIVRRFDEIVAFAEVEKFIDTPVKRYSSGMYLRLAFAVAAHLEPEILLVDEVLAVGDAEFQKKCLGKLSDVAKEGRTVLFVSHNLPTITSLCSKVSLFDKGRIIFTGFPEQCVAEYVRQGETKAALNSAEPSRRIGSGAIRFAGWSLLDRILGEGKQVRCGQSCSFRIAFLNSLWLRRRLSVEIAIVIKDEMGRPLLTGSTKFVNANFERLPKSGTIICHFDQFALRPGSYRLHLWCAVDGEVADFVEHGGSFEVVPFDVFRSGQVPEKKHGYFALPHSWRLESQNHGEEITSYESHRTEDSWA